MAVAVNADAYTIGRLNRFFTANNNTSADGNLTGQCVTLLKWFFNDMCDGFPSPFAARGDARYVGQTLVNQGLAVEVPWDQRRRGDVICYIFGTYGHIALQLSGGQVFEENVSWPGVASRIVEGSYVYASRIGSEAEAWRVGKNPHVYRIKSYNEQGENMPTLVDDGNVELLYEVALHRGPSQADKDARRGQVYTTALQELFESKEYAVQDAELKNPHTGNIAPGTYLEVDPAKVTTVK